MSGVKLSQQLSGHVEYDGAAREAGADCWIPPTGAESKHTTVFGLEAGASGAGVPGMSAPCLLRVCSAAPGQNQELRASQTYHRVHRVLKGLTADKSIIANEGSNKVSMR